MLQRADGLERVPRIHARAGRWLGGGGAPRRHRVALAEWPGPIGGGGGGGRGALGVALGGGGGGGRSPQLGGALSGSGCQGGGRGDRGERGGGGEGEAGGPGVQSLFRRLAGRGGTPLGPRGSGAGR